VINSRSCNPLTYAYIAHGMRNELTGKKLLEKKEKRGL